MTEKTITTIENETSKPTDSSPINEALMTYLAAMDTIRRTAYQVLPITAKWASDELKKKIVRIEKFKPHAYPQENATEYRLRTAHEAAELADALYDYEEFRGEQILLTLERSLFTQMFSEYDSFTGALLTAVYSGKADLLKSISREVSLSELLEFDTLEEVKLNMLEKEIETFRRDSYAEQFSALEKKFKINTLKAFKEWGEFIELAQRRNILMHNGGRVSEQYLIVCDREGHRFKLRPAVGDVLKAGPEYFSRAIVVMTKVGFMLTHTLWRKVFPGDSEVQAAAINATIYDVLRQKRWKTAAELSEFALGKPMREGVSDVDLRVRVVNCCIALKFSDRASEAVQLLDSVDWSAAYRDFRLARAVLRDDFDEAASLMRSIGKSGEMVDEMAYHQWPLFHKFREREEFQAAYESIYGRTFSSKLVEDARVSAEVKELKSDKSTALNAPPAKKARRKPALNATPEKRGERGGA